MNEVVSLEDWQIEEVASCMADPEYFVETFCWLQQKASAGVSGKDAVIPFIMGHEPGESHFFQRQILRWLHSRENVLTLKSRRVGCSWIAAAYAAWMVNFFESVNILFISRTGKDAQKILAKVKFILKNLAYHDNENIRQATEAGWLRSEIGTDNTEKLSILWRNDSGDVVSESVVESITNTDDSARGDDATFIVFDELAFYEHPDDTWSSANKTLAHGGHWMAISTPNGVGDVFHRMCAQADLVEQGQSDEPLDFEYIKVHWSEAGISPDQIRKSSVGDTQEKKNQEWEFLFIVPGNTVFDPTHLAACYKPLDQYPDLAYTLQHYHTNLGNDRFYYLGGDTSRAKKHRKTTEKDFHVFTALTNTRIQAFCYSSQIPISRWAGKVIEAGDGKRVEVKGKLSELHEAWPGLLYIEETGPGLTAYNNHILPQDTFSEVVPIDIKHMIKRNAVERLVILVESHQIVITDLETYQQMMVYQQTAPGVYEAPPGYHDDKVTALMLASAALDKHGALSFEFGALDGLKRNNQLETLGTEKADAFSGGPQVQIDPYHQRMTDMVPSLPAQPGGVERYNDLVQADNKILQKLLERGY